MVNLGNAWHIPQNPEPRGRGGMRDPLGAIVPGTDITVVSGNQFQRGGNPGNQLEVGSSLFFKRVTDPDWTELPLTFRSEAGNNKYFAATIPAVTTGGFSVGESLQYYLRIAYDDHDSTFLHARDDGSATTADESAAQTQPFTFPLEDPARWGRWAPVFTLPNVAIHTHVLPNGRVLMWGRRVDSDPDLDVQSCAPFVWDPEPNAPMDPPAPEDRARRPRAKTVRTGPPLGIDGKPVNLFCSGHAFLPDGRLLVVGGHQADSDGLNQASIYTPSPAGSDDPGTWTAAKPMGGDHFRRWYPTARALPDGSVLVLSGSYIDPTKPQGERTVIVPALQLWKDGEWQPIRKPDGAELDFIGLPLYPRMHVISDGRVLMSGTNATTYLLKTTEPGGWTEVDGRDAGLRDYCPAVMFGRDRIIYIGGGNDPVPNNASADVPRPPTARAEVIDLNRDQPQSADWADTKPMRYRRRQHNAVVLPDGTVLVIGGTRGGGGTRPDKGVTGFNDLREGQPVHAAELWDPNGDNGAGAWQELAAEEIDRCYHSTAVLLPDARVLSAGGGEYRPDDKNPNPAEDTRREAQIYSPPYLFHGGRPVITSAPASVHYGEAFDIETSNATTISKVTWTRLASVTHSFDHNQHVNFPEFTETGTNRWQVAAPSRPELCPPGHYMMFVLNETGVPSEASIIQIGAAAGATPEIGHAPAVPAAATRRAAATTPSRGSVAPSPGDYAYPPISAPHGTAITIGIIGTCPYGIGACWGGAYDALGRLDGVDSVNPVPNTHDSTAQVFLADWGLPALDRWTEQFQHRANGTYQLRGFEATVRGVVTRANGELLLKGTQRRPDVALAPLSVDKVQWDHERAAPRQPEDSELRAYDDLAAHSLSADQEVTLTGRLIEAPTGYRLHVRLVET
jgi:galactose oxidase